MHISVTALLVLASSWRPIAAANSHVVDLTRDLTASDNADETYNTFVSKLQKSYVYFYTPYSAHCRAVTPLLDQVASYMTDAPWIQFAKVNCADAGPFCESQEIMSFPELREYNGEDRFAPTGLAAKYGGSQDVVDHFKDLTHGQAPYSPKPKQSSKSKTSPALAPNPSPNATAANSIYLTEDGSTAIVKLKLPGVSLIEQGGDHASSIILNFTISENRYHLLLNNKLFALQVPNPSIPPLLTALQVFEDADLDKFVHDQDYRNLLSGTKPSQRLELDYEFDMTPRDDPTIKYGRHTATLRVNLIGAHLTSIDGSPNFMLDLTEQKMIELKLSEAHVKAHRLVMSNDPDRNYTIEAVKFLDRPSDYRAPNPHDARVCGLLSWRCADIGDAPWYRQVWRFQFDECGRIGSWRRRMLLAWLASRPVVLYVLLPAWGVVLGWKVWQILRGSRVDLDKPLPPLPFGEKREDSIK